MVFYRLPRNPAVNVMGVVKDVRLSDNRILATTEAFQIADECRSEAKLEANEIAETPAAAPKQP